MPAQLGGFLTNARPPPVSHRSWGFSFLTQTQLSARVQETGLCPFISLILNALLATGLLFWILSRSLHRLLCPNSFLVYLKQDSAPARRSPEPSLDSPL